MADALNNLFELDDLNEGGNKREKLEFPENIPTKFRLTDIKEGVLGKSGFQYYVLICTVLDGDYKDKEHEIFVNTQYKNKEGQVKGSHTFKKVLGGLFKGFSRLEISEGRGNDLVDSVKSQIDRVIGHDIEIAFFKAEGGFQNLIYVRDLSAKEVKPEVEKGSKVSAPVKKENF